LIIVGLVPVVAAASKADPLWQETELEGVAIPVLPTSPPAKANVTVRPLRTRQVHIARAQPDLQVTDAAVATAEIVATTHSALEPKLLGADLGGAAVVVRLAPGRQALAQHRVTRIHTAVVGICSAARHTDVPVLERPEQAILVVLALRVVLAIRRQADLRAVLSKKHDCAHLLRLTFVVVATAGHTLVDLPLAIESFEAMVIDGAALEALAYLQLAVAVLRAEAWAAPELTARFVLIQVAELRRGAVHIVVTGGLETEAFDLPFDLGLDADLSHFAVTVIAAARTAAVPGAERAGQAVPIVSAPLDTFAFLQRAGEPQRTSDLAAPVLATGLDERAVAVLGVAAVGVPEAQDALAAEQALVAGQAPLGVLAVCVLAAPLAALTIERADLPHSTISIRPAGLAAAVGLTHEPVHTVHVCSAHAQGLLVVAIEGALLIPPAAGGAGLLLADAARATERVLFARLGPASAVLRVTDLLIATIVRVGPAAVDARGPLQIEIDPTVLRIRAAGVAVADRRRASPERLLPHNLGALQVAIALVVVPTALAAFKADGVAESTRLAVVVQAAPVDAQPQLAVAAAPFGAGADPASHRAPSALKLAIRVGGAIFVGATGGPHTRSVLVADQIAATVVIHLATDDADPCVGIACAFAVVVANARDRAEAFAAHTLARAVCRFRAAALAALLNADPLRRALRVAATPQHARRELPIPVAQLAGPALLVHQATQRAASSGLVVAHGRLETIVGVDPAPELTHEAKPEPLLPAVLAIHAVVVLNARRRRAALGLGLLVHTDQHADFTLEADTVIATALDAGVVGAVVVLDTVFILKTPGLTQPLLQVAIHSQPTIAGSTAFGADAPVAAVRLRRQAARVLLALSVATEAVADPIQAGAVVVLDAARHADQGVGVAQRRRAFAVVLARGAALSLKTIPLGARHRFAARAQTVQTARTLPATQLVAAPERTDAAAAEETLLAVIVGLARIVDAGAGARVAGEAAAAVVGLNAATRLAGAALGEGVGAECIVGAVLVRLARGTAQPLFKIPPFHTRTDLLVSTLGVRATAIAARLHSQITEAAQQTATVGQAARYAGARLRVTIRLIAALSGTAALRTHSQKPVAIAVEPRGTVLVRDAGDVRAAPVVTDTSKLRRAAARVVQAGLEAAPELGVAGEAFGAIEVGKAPLLTRPLDADPWGVTGFIGVAVQAHIGNDVLFRHVGVDVREVRVRVHIHVAVHVGTRVGIDADPRDAGGGITRAITGKIVVRLRRIRAPDTQNDGAYRKTAETQRRLLQKVAIDTVADRQFCATAGSRAGARACGRSYGSRCREAARRASCRPWSSGGFPG
jgi:hypothetical protein